MKEIDRAAVDQKTIRFFGRAAFVLLGVIAVVLGIALLAEIAAPKEHAHGEYDRVHSDKFASPRET